MPSATRHPVHSSWQVIVTDRAVYVRPGVQVLVRKGKAYRSRFWRRHKLDLAGFQRVHTRNLWSDA